MVFAFTRTTNATTISLRGCPKNISGASEPSDFLHSRNANSTILAQIGPFDRLEYSPGIIFQTASEPRKPASAGELAVRRQRPDVIARQDEKQLLHERDAVARVRIAALGAFGQNPPCDGQAHAAQNDADHEDVDVGSAELPVGAVHGKNPAIGGFRGHGQNYRSDPSRWKRACGEEALETPVDRLSFVGGEGMAGEPDKRDGTLADDRQSKHQEACQPGCGQAKVRLEMLAEGLHCGFGGSGIVFLVIHNKDLHPGLPFINLS